MDKKLFVQLNGSRQIIGVLRGYDVFLNIVLDEAVEKKPNGDHVKVGTTVIRGNSVVLIEVRTSFKKIIEFIPFVWRFYSILTTIFFIFIGSGKNLEIHDFFIYSGIILISYLFITFIQLKNVSRSQGTRHLIHGNPTYSRGHYKLIKQQQ